MVGESVQNENNEKRQKGWNNGEWGWRCFAATTLEYHSKEVPIITAAGPPTAGAGGAGDGPTAVESGKYIPIIPVSIQINALKKLQHPWQMT